jgi:hypothetical protein
MNTLRFATMMLALACLLAWCSTVGGCAGGYKNIHLAALDPEDKRAVDATVQAWAEAAQGGELAPLKGECLIEQARVVHTTTAAQFTRECAGWLVNGAASCASQESHQVGLVVYSVPKVILRPGQPSILPTGQSPVAHELVHTGAGCALDLPGTGLNAQDPQHRDPRLFVVASKNPKVQALSVEGRAWLILKQPPVPLTETLK